MLTFWGMTIADIVANSMIIEQVFTIPGMGSLLISSISNRDYPVVQGIIILVAALVVVVNFIVDVLYGRIDPRIRIRKLTEKRAVSEKGNIAKYDFIKTIIFSSNIWL